MSLLRSIASLSVPRTSFAQRCLHSSLNILNVHFSTSAHQFPTFSRRISNHSTRTYRTTTSTTIPRCTRHFSVTPTDSNSNSNSNSTPAPTSNSSSSSSPEFQSLINGPYDHLLIEVRSHVLYITLNRPKLHNAFNSKVIQELHTIFTSPIITQSTRIDNSTTSDSASSPSGIRCVVLQSVGPSFSAGADLNWMQSMRTATAAQNQSDAEALFAMIHSIDSCPLPTISRIQGAALGGGVGLISSCDINIAIESAIFGLTEVKLGLAPAVISKFVMEKIGVGNARKLFLTGEKVNAKEAEKIGLVQGVVKDEVELDKEVERIVNEIRAAGPFAVQRTKQLIKNVGKMGSVEESKEAVTKLIAELRVGKEGQEGLASFLEKK